MSALSNVSVVLPSLDPDEKLAAVIDGLLKYGFSDIILVNDGSKPDHLHYFEDAVRLHPQVQLLHHPFNRGKGAALKTAFSYILANRPNSAGVVTVDGDNQHHPEDTRRCAEEMLKSGKLILGVRDFSQPEVPFRSRTGNRITSFIFKIFVGMTISDTQTGLRAIPARFLPQMLQVSGERFEYETSMLLALKQHSIPYAEVKIRTVYIEENKASHFRAVQDSWRIYRLIFAHFFKYALSSIISAVVDEGIFTLLSRILHSRLTGLLLTAVPTVCARLISSLLNFFLNKKLVFQSQTNTGKALVRYYALAIPTMLAQLAANHGLFLLLHIQPEQTLLRALIHGLVMVVLSLINFMIQQRWVFPNKSPEDHSI